jgi:hypothetical protein
MKQKKKEYSFIVLLLFKKKQKQKPKEKSSSKNNISKKSHKIFCVFFIKNKKKQTRIIYDRYVIFILKLIENESINS